MMEEAAGASYPQAANKLAVREDVTVRQNIDAKIARHQVAIAELEATKAELGALMDMRIDRLRSAMNNGVY